MKSHFSMSVLTIFLTITLIAPSIFFVAPQKVHAIPVEVVGTVSLPVELKDTIENTISAVAEPLTAVATTLAQVNSYVLQPLAMVLSGNLLKSITASVTAFVTGKSNGTGKAQFTTNLQGTLQTTGDVQALAFFAQMKGSNSPFAAAITSSLTNNYLQNTSLAGFFSANQCTLSKSSPNINSFLAGNWSQGGIGAWFALTTQNQNNPYTLYQTSQSQLANVVGGAQSAQLEQLGWGQGMSSWCGPTTSSSSAAPCTNKNGTPGKIQTPGSTISASLNKALGTDQSKLVSMGSAGSGINSILSSVGTVLKTMALVTTIVNGGKSGGLLGVSNTSATSRNTSAFTQYQSTPFLGVAPSAIIQSAPSLPASGSTMSNNISQYQSAWNTISVAANTASTSVVALANDTSCATQASAAQTALTTEIAPVFAQAATASTNIATANAMVQQAQNDSVTDTTGTAYANDVTTLQAMSPTSADVANAQQNAQAFGAATANPDGSLTVSGGSLVDQMNLISANANALKTVCDTPSPPSDSN